MCWLAGVVITLFLLASTAYASDAPRVTQPFRDEHKELKVHLEHMLAMSAAVRSSENPDVEMQRLLSALQGHIVPHAEWEEAVLYPAVDRYAGAGERQFTETMRYEHRIVGRWLAELASLANAPSANREEFAQKADQLLGLIVAHFEVEEEVLLAVLDSQMTADEFGSEILEKLHEH